jgi:hypothetical protein
MRWTAAGQRYRLTAVSLVSLCVLACGDSTDPPTPETVEVTPNTAARDVGQSVQLSATVKDASGNILSGQSVNWSSSATAVASVSASGLVVAVSPGSSIITAAVANRAGVATITVNDPPNPCSTAQAPAIAVGQTINGALTGTDCKLTDNTYADGYGLQVTAGTNVQIDLTASSFDTYLVLLELLSNGTLVQRALNDDLDPDDPGDPNDPVDTNSRITFALQPGLAYFILANSFDPNVFGDYQLKVTAMPFATASSIAGKPGKAPIKELLKAIKPPK